MNLVDRFLNRIAFDTGEGGGGGEGGEGGSGGSGWLSSVPENLRSHEAFKGIEKASDAWQEFVDLKVSSKGAIHIPGENATDEERNAYYKAIGRPDSADQYDLPDPQIPDGMEYNPEVKTVFQSVFYELDLPGQVAQKLWNKYNEAAIEGYNLQQKTEKEATEKAINELKDLWKGDTFKTNTELAKRTFLKQFEGDEEAVKFIEETKINGLALGNHPIFLKVFHKLGSLISDDSAAGGRGGEGGQVSDEEKAKQRFPNTKWRQ